MLATLPLILPRLKVLPVALKLPPTLRLRLESVLSFMDGKLCAFTVWDELVEGIGEGFPVDAVAEEQIDRAERMFEKSYCW